MSTQFTLTAYALLLIFMHEYAPYVSTKLTIPEAMHYRTVRRYSRILLQLG
jgi:hypothetical protein